MVIWPLEGNCKTKPQNVSEYMFPWQKGSIQKTCINKEGESVMIVTYHLF